MPKKVGHNTTNAELQHYMKLVGVKPVSANWRTSWPEWLREKVAIYCTSRHLAERGVPQVDVPQKPKVVR